MRILHIIEELGVGGAEKLLIETINNLSDHEQHLIVLWGKNEYRKNINVKYEFWNLNCRSFFRMLMQSGKVRRYIKRNRIEIVHSHLYQANILSRLSAPSNVKLFNSIHAISSQAAYKGHHIWLMLEKITYRKIHHIICVSKAVLDDFKKFVGVKGKTTVLYNFINENYFYPAPKQEFSTSGLKLVAVGNLRWQKNYPYLINAFKQLPDSVSLDIYGEGSMRAELQSQIDQFKLNIRLCGIHENLFESLRQYDAFVMSSFFEGQPLALLEAMAVGLPCFLADIPELREVAAENAVYFDTGDNASLNEKIKLVLDKKIDLKPLASGALTRVNEFAHSRQYFERLLNLYTNG